MFKWTFSRTFKGKTWYLYFFYLSKKCRWYVLVIRVHHTAKCKFSSISKNRILELKKLKFIIVSLEISIFFWYVLHPRYYYLWFLFINTFISIFYWFLILKDKKWGYFSVQNIFSTSFFRWLPLHLLVRRVEETMRVVTVFNPMMRVLPISDL